jgi:hypothetical protein
MTTRPLQFAPAILLTAAGIAFAPDVSTDYEQNTEFARLHTYSWIGVRAGTSIWQDRIAQAVDAELKAKGWQRVESGADTLETFYAGFPGWGWRGWNGMGTATTTVVTLNEAVEKMFRHFPPPSKG